MTRSGWSARASALLLLVLTLAVRAASAQTPPASPAAPASAASAVVTSPGLALLPAPRSLTRGAGTFTLNSGTDIVTDHDLRAVGTLFGQMIAPATGFTLKLRPQPAPKSNVILMVVDATLGRLGQEGYLLDITPDRVVIRVFAPAGAFYATQTLRQLLPPAIFGNTRADGPWTLPVLAIEDVPRFAWRGLMLDAAHHFIPKTEVLKFIDLLALHKMNTLHWHLTDDQGWRLEIRKYPKLTATAAAHRDARAADAGAGAPAGAAAPRSGFYTQGDVREVVAYARARFVTIVPEIAMPGHAAAAIAAYPELGVTDAAPPPANAAAASGTPSGEAGGAGSMSGGASGSTASGASSGATETPAQEIAAPQPSTPSQLFDPTERTLQFLQDVLTEVLALFPGRYIHVGGDTESKEAWKTSPNVQARIKALGLRDEDALQGYVINQMDGFLTRRGRRLIGGDGILGSTLAPGASILSWRGVDYAVAAVRTGHDIVSAPLQVLAFDRPQAADAANAAAAPAASAAPGAGGAPAASGAANGAPGAASLEAVSLEAVYAFEPVPPALTPAQAPRVLGAQALLRTETIDTPARLEYMALPRLAALAEAIWSSREHRTFDEFRARLQAHEARLKAMGVSYRPLAADDDRRAAAGAPPR